MTKLESQIRELSPSVKDALYRRLLFAEDLAWLRDEKKKDTVIGFEVDLDGQELSGFALIAIQRHTVIAFVSDRDESPRLILFPSLEILFDPGFELLNLIVTKKEFTNAAFCGPVLGHGRFGDMVKDLTPPNRKVDISDTVSQQILEIIEQEAEKPVQEPVQPLKQPKVMKEPVEEAPEDFYQEPDDYAGYEEPSYDDYESAGYDDYDDYDDYEEPVKELTRSEKLKAQNFHSLSEVTDFAVMKLGINRPLAVTLVNKAMQSNVSPQYRIQLAVNIFCKLIDENKI